MTIPKIAPYPLPTRAELPDNRAPFRPDPARAVLLVHDMQRYFLDFFAKGASPLAPLLHNVQQLMTLCRAREVPVVFSAQPSDRARAARGLLDAMWGPGLPAYPERADIAPELAPRSDERVFIKTRYSAFVRTELLSFLHACGRDQLWICGVYAHIGCLFTAGEAFMNDIQPFVVADAIADFSRERHDAALSIIADCCGAVVDTAQLDALLRGEASYTALRLRDELGKLGVAADTLTDADDLRDAGLDSVRLLELTERLAGEGYEVTMVDLMECSTFGALRRCVEGQVKDGCPA
jgi:bifunctional isochorismate lyase/aryl carrier protein